MILNGFDEIYLIGECLYLKKLIKKSFEEKMPALSPPPCGTYSLVLFMYNNYSAVIFRIEVADFS